MASDLRFPPGTRAAVVNLHKGCENSANLLARITRFLQLADVSVVGDCELAEVLLRISALVEAVPGIGELDVNPLVITESGLCAIDARVVPAK